VCLADTWLKEQCSLRITRNSSVSLFSQKTMSDLEDRSFEYNEVSDRTAVVHQSVVLGPLMDSEFGAGECEGFYVRRQLVSGI